MTRAYLVFVDPVDPVEESLMPAVLADLLMDTGRFLGVGVEEAPECELAHVVDEQRARIADDLE